MKTTRSIVLLAASMLLILAACALPATTTIQENSTVDSSTENRNPEKVSAEQTEETTEEDTAMADDEAMLFTIDAAQSEARFELGEDLRGSRVIVVGTTSALSGEIEIDPATPANTRVGTITIDAATFVTDSDRRDGAIRRFVLNTASYPNITFRPTSLNAIPDSIAVGETVSFEIRGDLTLKDQTRSEIFKTTITVDSESQISGSVTAVIYYADYGIFVPDVPFVANVDDSLELEFDFVAVK